MVMDWRPIDGDNSQRTATISGGKWWAGDRWTVMADTGQRPTAGDNRGQQEDRRWRQVGGS